MKYKHIVEDNTMQYILMPERFAASQAREFLHIKLYIKTLKSKIN